MIDYSILDTPEITNRMFYPESMWWPPENTVEDHRIPVDSNVSISARYYPSEPSFPAILFFHGNGEISCQYDMMSRYYTRAEAGLFVADFRGYGLSSGTPSFSSMISDSSAIFMYFESYMATQELARPLFVMGRSLGCHSAVAVAATYQDRIAGLITESGSASIERSLQRLGLPENSPQVETLLDMHREKLKSISIPVLAIHGAMDSMVSIDAATELLESIGSENKTFQVIPKAGHNDLLMLGGEQYTEALAKFIHENSK